MNLECYRYQRVDKGLWIYGRFVDKKSTLRKEMDQRYIDKIEKLENLVRQKIHPNEN